MTWKTRATFGLLASVCALILPASCGRVEGQFIVVQDQVPQTGCTIPSDLSALYRPQGFLDISILSKDSHAGYLLFPLLENDLPGVTTGQLVDGNRIALAGWEVSLGPPPNTSFPPTIQMIFNQNPHLTSYPTPTSGSVASGGGHTASIVDVFPPALAVLVGTAPPNEQSFMVYATVHAIGNRINGSIQSDDFVFPISVCNGCLVRADTLCPLHGTPANPGNPCNPAQDEVIDCCTMNTKPICPPLVSQ